MPEIGDVKPSDDPTSGARGHAAAQAIIHNPDAPSNTLRPTPPKVQAVAGLYRLKVSVWRELVSKAGEAKRFVEHVYGDIVQLAEHDAERLLRGGAVEPTTDEQKATAAAQEPTVFEKAQTYSAMFPQPVDGAAPMSPVTSATDGPPSRGLS